MVDLEEVRGSEVSKIYRFFYRMFFPEAYVWWCMTEALKDEMKRKNEAMERYFQNKYPGLFCKGNKTEVQK